MTTNDRRGENDLELLTIAEVATAVRVPLGTLRYWRFVGAGPRSFLVGRRVVYRRTEIDRWLDDQEARDGAFDGATTPEVG